MARRGLVKWRMQSQNTPRPHGVPESFYSKFGKLITAVLSGFDRIRFRASLRMLYQAGVMERYFGYCGVRLKEFKSFAEATTAKVKRWRFVLQIHPSSSNCHQQTPNFRPRKSARCGRSANSVKPLQAADSVTKSIICNCLISKPLFRTSCIDGEFKEYST